MIIDDLISLPQFSLHQSEKDKMMLELMKTLHDHHVANSVAYKEICKRVFRNEVNFNSIEDLPFIPVSAFKNHHLLSVKDGDIFKVLTSSGTTGQSVSKIYLDKDTARLQSVALSKIIAHVVGPHRLPMLVIDSKAVYANKSSFSARGAGILGIAPFGKDHTYVLNENFEPDEEVLENFLEKYNGQRIFIFGFTFMVWQFLQKANFDKKYDLSNAILMHSGGWKKLIEMAVDNKTFRQRLKDKFNLKNIYNYYGMVEQVGSVFMENKNGYLHAPNFADVIIRNPIDFSVQPVGEPGLIQVLSVLPKSYPGHSLLTEDIGVLEGIDDSPEGWKGKYFRILGRAKKAELRGCSDTFNK
jgi:phenylacetate-coenzyme A ligase PaaK-like adenylate-forming protein